MHGDGPAGPRLQRGPRASLTFGWQASPDDKFDTEAAASYRTFTTGAVDPVSGQPVSMPPVGIATLTETWRRTFTSKLSAWAGLGGAATSVNLAPPVVDFGMQYVTDGGLRRIRLSGHYGPLVDAVTGHVFPRADVTLGVSWSSWRNWRVAADLTGGISAGGATDGPSVLGGEVRLVHNLTRELDLSTGVRGFWQHPPSDSAILSYRQLGVFVALAYLHRDKF